MRRSISRPGAGDSLPVRYAVLAHDLGKATTAPANWPRHIAHEARAHRDKLDGLRSSEIIANHFDDSLGTAP